MWLTFRVWPADAHGAGRCETALEGNDTVVATQRSLTDAAPAQYVGELDRLWADWEPGLARAERYLNRTLAGADSEYDSGDAVVAELRRIQYRAHSVTELAAGLQPPLTALDAHTFLIAALDGGRDALGALAEHVSEEDPDPRALSVVLESLRTTRDAFRVARASSSLLAGHAAFADPGFSPLATVRSRPRTSMVVAWLLMVICSGLLTALIYEIVRA